MKKINFLVGLYLFIFAVTSYAVEKSSSLALQNNVLAEPGSTQYVVIMNALSNPAAANLSKSNVMVRFYDGTGNNPPCWTADKITYHSDPYVAGAGGRNACGKPGYQPAGIVKIDIFPLRAPAGKIYNDLYGVNVDAAKFYTGIIIEQDIAPIFNQDGTLKTPGTVKVSSIGENLVERAVTIRGFN